jgi:hypothetical protein
MQPKINCQVKHLRAFILYRAISNDEIGRHFFFQRAELHIYCPYHMCFLRPVLPAESYEFKGRKYYQDMQVLGGKHILHLLQH